MINWIDKSDKNSAFFVADTVSDRDQQSSNRLLEHMFEFLTSNILGKGNATQADKFFLEVNCDTGRLILSAATEANREAGKLDGCAIRSQALQDFWYDLDESGITEAEFTRNIGEKVMEFGLQLREILSSRKQDLQLGNNEDLEIVVFGSDPGVVVYRATLE